MNKMVLAGLLVGLGLVAVGCDNNKKPTTNTPPLADPGTVQPQPYVPTNQSAAINVTPVPDSSSGSIVTPPSGTPMEPTGTKKTHHPAASGDTTAAVAGTTYTVKRGDSLSKIAKKVYGSASQKNINKIKTANSLKSDVIREGQKLKIPGGSSSSGTVTKKKKTIDGNKG